VCLAMPDDVSYLQINSNASASIQTGAFPLGKDLCAEGGEDCCGKAAGELRGAIANLGEQAVFAALIAFGFPKKTATLVRNGLAVGAKEVKEFELPAKSFEFYKEKWSNIKFTGEGKYGDGKDVGDFFSTLGGDIAGVAKGAGKSIALGTSKATDGVVGGSVTAAKAVTKFATKNLGTIITVVVCGAGVAFAPIITLCIARLVLDAAEVAWDATNGIQEVANWARTVIKCGPSCDPKGNGDNDQYGDCAASDVAGVEGPDCLKQKNDPRCAGPNAKMANLKKDQLADLDKM